MDAVHLRDVTYNELARRGFRVQVLKSEIITGEVSG